MKSPPRYFRGKRLLLEYVIPSGAQRPGGVSLAVGLGLPAAPGIEAPDTAGKLEDGTRVLSRRLGRAVLHLTRVGRRADVHVQLAVRADDDALGGVLAPVRQAADDSIGTAVGCELTDVPMPPHDGVVGCEVEILTGEHDPVAATDPK